MARLHGFMKKDLMEIFQLMVTARTMDDKMLTMLKQGKSYFHIGSAGHEAAQIAASKVLRAGEDWSYPYYRDAAYCLGLGLSTRDQFLTFLARKDDPSSGGRQMPQHFGSYPLRIVSQSSPTGTQFLQATGTALSRRLDDTKEIVYVSSGEGTTSQGEFHEALNWASREKLPVIFHIEDNNYAISVPKVDQTSGGSVYAMVAGFTNLARYDVDGTDFFETQIAFKKAADRARKGKGPAVIVSNVVRLLPHSSSDDQRKYRKSEELEADKKRDPIVVFEEKCIEAGAVSKSDFDSIRKAVVKKVNSDADWAEAQDHPDPSTVLDGLYGEPLKIDHVETFEPVADKLVIVDAINHALNEELEKNSKMIVYGQDIADPKGGVFTATKGLSSKFGKKRVFNSPLAEASIIGTAVGLALTGYKPVVEIQFGDYIWTAMMQIRNEVATMRYRSNNTWSCPMVIRVPVGGYIHGGLCHSQSIDGYFLHLPGIFIAYPSNASDAKALLKTACRMDDPVIFMEHKGLYRQGYAATEEPGEDFLLPFGKARVVQKGEALTVITWGAMVQKTIEAVSRIEIEDSVEIIDLRTLNPMDMEAIERSISKTGKVLIVHEDSMTGGPGAEVAARISDTFFEMLDAPIKRVGAKDSPVPFNWYLEEQVLPQAEDIRSAITDLLEY